MYRPIIKSFHHRIYDILEYPDLGSEHHMWQLIFRIDINEIQNAKQLDGDEKRNHSDVMADHIINHVLKIVERQLPKT